MLLSEATSSEPLGTTRKISERKQDLVLRNHFEWSLDTAIDAYMRQYPIMGPAIVDRLYARRLGGGT